MKNILKVSCLSIFLLFSLSMQAGDGYRLFYSKGVMNSVFFNVDSSNPSQKIVRGADGATFRVLKDEKGRDLDCYGIDKSSVFYADRKLEKADPNTFKHLTDTISMLRSYYGKDKNYVYYMDWLLKDADVNTFRVISDQGRQYGGYAIDRNHVYLEGRILDKYDAHTFQLLVYDYLLDKSGVYFDEELIPNANYEDSEQIGCYIKSNNAIFLYTHQYPSFDAHTFEVVHIFKSYSSSGDYSLEGAIVKDKNGIYSHHFPYTLPYDVVDSSDQDKIKKLEDIDTASFGFREMHHKSYMIDIPSFEDENNYYIIYFDSDNSAIIIRKSKQAFENEDVLNNWIKAKVKSLPI